VGTYESVLLTVDAEQYVGTPSSLIVLRRLLTRQQPPSALTITGFRVPFVRYPDRPDEPLIPGNWVTMTPDGWASHMNPEAFKRLFRSQTWEPQ
jgi:hypothetical protein